MVTAIQKARALVGDTRHQDTNGAIVPRIFSPPYGGASYYGQAYRWEQVLHYKYWTFAAISASIREVAGSGMPNIGRVTKRDPEEESKILKWIQSAIVNKSLRAEHVRTALHKQLVAKHLIDEVGFKAGSVNRVMRLTPKRVRKALGGPKQHQDFDPFEDDHPLVRVYKRPNHHYVAYDLWAYHMLFKGLTGQVHWWVMRNNLGMVVEIWVIPTHWMRLETDGYGRPVSYAVQSPWGQVQHVPYDQVVSFYDHSPLNLYEGTAVTQAISEWIDGYEAQVRARLAMFKNGGAPAFHIALGESFADPDEAFLGRYYSKWAARFQGENNYGRPIITGADIEIKNIGVQPDQIPFAQGEDQGRDMTLAAYGVPKGVLGLEPVSDVSAYAPQRQYVRFRINPELKYIGEVNTEKVVKPTPGHDDGVFFFDDHVIDDPEQQLREIQAKWEKGAISPNEIRLMFGDEPWEYGGDDPVLNGSPVNWCTGKEPEPELTNALQSELSSDEPRPEYSLSQLKSGKWVVLDSSDNIILGPFDTQEDAEIALSKKAAQEEASEESDDPGLIENELETEPVAKESDSPAILRWHKTPTGNLEARGASKWKISRDVNRTTGEVTYKLYRDGKVVDSSGAMGVVKEVAEKSEKVEKDKAEQGAITNLQEGKDDSPVQKRFSLIEKQSRRSMRMIDKRMDRLERLLEMKVMQPTQPIQNQIINKMPEAPAIHNRIEVPPQQTNITNEISVPEPKAVTNVTVESPKVMVASPTVMNEINVPVPSVTNEVNIPQAHTDVHVRNIVDTPNIKNVVKVKKPKSDAPKKRTARRDDTGTWIIEDI